MSTFILEIGSEEIPAGFLCKEQAALASLLEEALNEAGLAYGAIEVEATPRRLIATISDVADEQALIEEVITGPPLKIAFDGEGQPGKALEGFLRSNNATLKDIETINTLKGEYIGLRRKTGGKPAGDVLAEICPDVIGKLSFGKSMRWGTNEFAYARPIRWILALLDDKVIPFAVGPIVSGRKTYGHRVHGLGPHTVAHAAEHQKILAETGVTANTKARLSHIVKTGEKLAEAKNGAVLWKDDLLEEVCGLVEHPVPLLGDFDPAYLEVPEEALLTSMETHQKSFGLRGPDGKLLPHFLTVLNIDPKDLAVVKQGWERVLRARLEDARFFWKSDLAQTFDEWLEKLEHVIFIGPLGSMADKSRRLEQLAGWLAAETGLGNAALARRAGKLAKADLVSGMVGEFDTLQGIMGGIYARENGENEEVAKAIAAQYLPSGLDSPLPDTSLGAILSMADKADTLAGCFGLGLAPTGAADPNGLRRCALGIVRILLDQKLNVDTKDIFAAALKLYGDKAWKQKNEEILARLDDFLLTRLRGLLLGQNYDTLVVDAALDAPFHGVYDCGQRVEALAEFYHSPEFGALIPVLKRVENIAKKNEGAPFVWEDTLLTEKAEKILASVLKELLPRLDDYLSNGQYKDAINLLADLREPVDNFFNNVMVMCEDEKIRVNRLAMLNAIRSRFSKIATFAKLQA